MTKISLAAMLLALTFLTVHGHAQSDPADSSALPAKMQQAAEEIQENRTTKQSSIAGTKNNLPGTDLSVPADIDCKQTDPSLLQSCRAAAREFYDYHTEGLQLRLAAFRWQHVSSMGIFFVVTFLVLCGVFFAGVQFFKDIRHTSTKATRTAATPHDATVPPTAQVMEVAISATGIQAKASVLGVIVLFISLAFFYLYLQFVYPITTTF